MSADLIERLEKAEVGSRDLDLAIERLTNISSVHDDHLDRFPDAAKPYTTSLDAIVGLIGEKLPGWHWTCSHSFNCPGQPEGKPFYADLASKEWIIGDVEHGNTEVFAASAPIALCIALLRSLKDSAHDR